MRKSAKNPAKRGKPFEQGPDPRRGHGPEKGAPNAGRPPDWWKGQLRELRDRFLIAAEAKGVLDDPDHPQWAKVGTWVHEQLEGKAKQTVDVNATVSIASELEAARQRALQRGDQKGDG